MYKVTYIEGEPEYYPTLEEAQKCEGYENIYKVTQDAEGNHEGEEVISYIKAEDLPW